VVLAQKISPDCRAGEAGSVVGTSAAGVGGAEVEVMVGVGLGRPGSKTSDVAVAVGGMSVRDGTNVQVGGKVIGRVGVQVGVTEGVTRARVG
jgi:hypothetical protein